MPVKAAVVPINRGNTTVTHVRAGLAFLTLSSIALAAASAVAAPALILSVKAGHPKIATSISGTGFTANEAVDVYFDTTDEFLAVTNSAGAFAARQLTIPKDALPGSHWITAVGRKTGDAAQQVFAVRTDWTKFAFDVQNRGRNPYENVIDSSNVGTLDVAWCSPQAARSTVRRQWWAT